MRVGLVLGGGGVAGLAYHAATLSALEHDLGWDPRQADVVVGTSAGALVASMLRRGVPASDLAALAVGRQPLETPAHLARAVTEREGLPAVAWRSLLRVPHPPNPRIVLGWLRRPWRLDPVAALASVVADGPIDLLAHAADHAHALGEDWPADEVWLCAVRQRDLRRVVFGRDARPPLATAALASCSIPGYFRPVLADGASYIDGGVRSPTNADVLRHRDLDLVIVVSPMSGHDVSGFGVGALSRRYAKAKLRAEVALLEANRIPTVVIEPGPDVVDAVGTDFMSDEHICDIVTTGFLDAGDQFRQPVVRTLLAGLSTRHRTPRPAAAERPPAGTRAQRSA